MATKRSAKKRKVAKKRKPLKVTVAPKPKGRPTDYTPELAAEICRRLAEVGNLRAVCRADDMPHEATVRTWALDDRDGFFTQYARARELGYLSMADELTEISDDSSGDEKLTDSGSVVMNTEFVGRSRLKVDTRKWLLSKALPKVFGDKLAVTGADGGSLKTEHEVTIIELVAQPIPSEMLDEPAPTTDDDE